MGVRITSGLRGLLSSLCLSLSGLKQAVESVGDDGVVRMAAPAASVVCKGVCRVDTLFPFTDLPGRQTAFVTEARLILPSE